MVKIAICDDDRSLAKNLAGYLERKNELTKSIDFEISLYYSGEDFLQDIKQECPFQIVFMDIEMGGLNGVEVGQVLRNTVDGDDVILIYMSSHDSYFEGIAHVGNFRFLNKPLKKEKVDEVFGRAFALAQKNLSSKPQLFQYKVNKETFFVKANEIVYLKSNNKLVEIHIWQPEGRMILCHDKFYSSLTAEARQFPSGFFVQCERSHIVNLNFMQSIAGNYFVLIDALETKIPIGRAYKEQARSVYAKYRRNQYE